MKLPFYSLIPFTHALGAGLRVVLLLAGLGWLGLPAQVGLQVDVGPDLFICQPQTVNLTAQAPDLLQTTSYRVDSIGFANPDYNPGGGPVFAPSGGVDVPIYYDDIWSDSLVLPFEFCFFGTTYRSFWVGSNGVLSFVNPSSFYHAWQINGPAPGSLFPNMSQCIMAPWHDMNPRVVQPGQTVSINTAVYGAMPYRKMVLSWANVPMYSSACDQNIALNSTQQVVLYETSNVIETFILSKQVCPTWNGGQAIHGIHGNGTFIGVPDRNADTPPIFNQWQVVNDAIRFTPDGPPASQTITWYQNGSQIGTGDSIQVNITASTTFSASASYGGCVGGAPVLSDTLDVIFGGNACEADSVILNTGYSPYTQQPITVGGFDRRWCVTQRPDGQPVPTASNVIQAHAGWSAPIGNSQWISPIGFTEYVTNNPPPAPPFRMEFCFCTCDSGAVNLRFELMADDNAEVFFDNNFIGATVPSYSFQRPNALLINTTRQVPKGKHCLQVDLRNTGYTAMGVNLAGVVEGPHLVQDTCCGSDVDLPDPIVVRPPDVTVAVEASPVTYAGNVTVPCNGWMVDVPLDVTGGSAPYTYAWNTGATTDTLYGVPAGTYWVVVTDSAGNTGTDTIILVEPPLLQDTATAVVPNCFGQSNGLIDIGVIGGVSPYTFVWSHGATTEDATGLGPGTYSVTISDANGCSTTSSYSIVMDSLDLSTGRTLLGDTVLVPPALDPLWRLTMFQGVSSQPGNPAEVVGRNAAWPVPLPGSQWLSSQPNGALNALGGLYTYERAFCLAAVDSSIRLEIQFHADDTCTLYLNDSLLAGPIWAINGPPIVVTVTDPGIFEVGDSNVLRAVVRNLQNGPHGLDLQARLYGCPALFCLTVAVPPREVSAPFADVTAFPNPTEGRLTVTGVPAHMRVTYTIMDLLGHTLITQAHPDIDLRALPAGTYLLQLRAREGTQVFRVVKQ